MNNIYKYITNYGNFSFEEKKVNELDILIFSQIPYIDFTKSFKTKKEEITLANLWKKAKNNKENYIGIVRKNAAKILDIISTKKRYKDLILKDYIYHLAEDTQFGAISIVVPKDYTYIVFEGTDSTIWGWKEDFKLAYTFPTYSQVLAAKYLNKNIKLFGPKVVVCGHSKGGNLALAGTMKTNILKKIKIHKIYSFDGPGLKEEEFKSLNYKLVRNKLVNIIPNLSLIGVLLNQENVTVIKSRGFGFNQHDVTTWITEDDHLKPHMQDKLSKRLDESISNWLATYNYKEREEIIEGIFSVFEFAGITNFSDINTPEEIYKIIKSSLDLSKETRDVILTSIKLLATGLSTDIINDGKKELQDNIEKYFGKDKKSKKKQIM